jgi:AAA15 family ATPase/GTPase
MKPYHLDPTDDTPKVSLDPVAGTFEFIGNSYPENTSKFYIPILDWMKEFNQAAPIEAITASFNFDYFNTTSAKYILEILRLVEEYKTSGHTCSVNWYFFEEDTDMLEAGEDYQRTVTVPFELIQRQDTF